ncbi:MAG: hypothetical protein IJO72_07080 [Oscillospiraceae bacterium]|nr:hypothetical protein [Oscillospiraceae bacterium]MBQ9930520.1 hypothetical protein [Oscillospiraceae bacterium]
MNKKIRWITETAAMLALLICLQWVGSLIPNQLIRQLITGTCVNAVLAVTVLLVGMSSGITVALISPVCAFVFGIAPNFITVAPIMLGNVCFVVLLKLLMCRKLWRQILALIAAAVVKFGVLYILVVQVICVMLKDDLLGKKIGEIVVLGPKMLESNMLPLMFSWPQLVTALVGGTLALLIVPTLRKALHK